MPTTDWERIHSEYVTGEISLRDVADRHGVPRSQVFERSSAEGWVEERRQFRSETGAKAVQLAQTQAVAASALIFQIAHFILSRYFDAIQQEGVVFDISDRNWAAKVLLELEEAGKGRTMIIEKADLSQLSDEQLDALVAHAGSTR